MDYSLFHENQYQIFPNISDVNFFTRNQIDENTINFFKNTNFKKTNKNDILYKCEFCEKTYWSKTAMRNHMFNKHNSLLASKNIIKHKAGRPRQHENDDNTYYNYMRNKYSKFWAVLKRKKDINTIINMENILNTVFKDLYGKYSNLLDNGENLKSWKEHPWLKLLINTKNNDINNNLNIIVNNNKNNLSCDSVLTMYVDYIKEKTNTNYLIFIIKFLVLFRDCFNNSKNIKFSNSENNNIERSTVISAEKIPEIANEFFTDYLPSKNFFENSLDLNSLNEMTELVQHLCHFLRLKNFSSLRLVLINKNADFNTKK